MRTTWVYMTAVVPLAGLPIVLLCPATLASSPTEQKAAKEGLSGRYFRLMEAELARVEKRVEMESDKGAEFNARHYPGALLAAAVLFAKRHPDNLSFGDKRKLALAL